MQVVDGAERSHHLLAADPDGGRTSQGLGVVAQVAADHQQVGVQTRREPPRLVVDPAARSALQPSAVQVGASPVDFDGNPGPQSPGTVNADLTFEFRTWPSVGRIRVQLPPGWAVKAIRLNGVDVTDKPIDFVAGKVVSGLEIEPVKRGDPRL